MPRREAITDKGGYPSLHAMGESALIVAFGNRVSVALRERVFSLYHALRKRNVTGVTDLVPAYGSLLIRFHPVLTTDAEVSGAIFPLLNKPGSEIPHTKHLVVPVHYGGDAGPDLGAVAAVHSLSEVEAVRLHSSRPYTVYFLGFLPGFAYMGQVARTLATPRLPTPRVSVPAGSVGIAGVQTGIYPFSSPGGWQLIGRTGVQVWNPYSPEPALFSPGDSVAFAPTGDSAVPPTSAPPRQELRHAIFEVIEPGALTTMQDLGRAGYAYLGLSTGGPCDREAALQANALVGNRPGAALLELTWSGPTLRAMQPGTIALEGADFGCRVDGTTVPVGLAWFVRAGATIKFAPASPSRRGLRAYLAVAGGFEAPMALGSRSTCLPAGFGGFEGRALKAGDLLGLDEPPESPAHLAGRYWLSRPDLALQGKATLRFVRYTGVGHGGGTTVQQLTAQEWRVSPQSDRMGLRLEPLSGPGLAIKSRGAVSFGVVRGAIQAPPGGKPVVLNADHQTTGGYPLVGVVAQADWPLLTQLQPGDVVRFTEVSLEEAVAALLGARTALLSGLGKLRLGSLVRDYALV